MQTVPNDRNHIAALAAYLHACFAWEFSNSNTVSVHGGSTLAAFECDIDTVASRLTARPHLTSQKRKKLNAALKRHVRGTSIIYGLFPIQLSDYQSGTKTEMLPLFLTEFEPWDEELEQAGSSTGDSTLFVNRILLEQLIAEPEQLESVAEQLQKIISTTALDKAAIAQLEHCLQIAIPNLQIEGFSRYPFCITLPPKSVDIEQSNTDHITEKNSPVMYCSTVVLLSRRSKQSMGILHELGQLQLADHFSPPIQQLSRSLDKNSSLKSSSTKKVVVDSKHNRVIGALSVAQSRAVAAAQKYDLSVVFGPPGCGKTHTLAMMTANTVASGESVLICARNKAAVDVVTRFLSDHLWLAGAMVNAGTHSDRKELKRRFQSTIQRGSVNLSKPHPQVTEYLSTENPLKSMRVGIKRNRKKLAQIDRAKRWLNHHIEHKTSIAGGNILLSRKIAITWSKVTAIFLKPSDLISDRDTDSLADAIEARNNLLDKRDDLVRESIQLKVQYQTGLVLKNDRRTLSNLADSFTAREFRQRQLQETIDYSQLLKTLPVWVTTLSDLNHLLPLDQSLFDLVIIDEASQADMASGLPALQRARRAVIMGDTEQLRHVSFLPVATEYELMQRQSGYFENSVALPGFRNTSVLDWANENLHSASAGQFLDEHFRSAPAIIGFSNKAFYQNQLKLLTQITLHNIENPIECIQVSNGIRQSKGHNPHEAKVLLHYFQQLLKSVSNNQSCPSIAVLSPFRAQCDHLQKLFEKEISGAERERSHLLIGTAHELQGEERDIVLMSAVVDNHSPGGAIGFLSRSDLLNVSITRARKKQVLFISRDLDKFDQKSLFGQYLQWVVRDFEDTRATQSKELNSEARSLLATLSKDIALESVDFDVEIGEININILVRAKKAKLGLDLIGFKQKANKSALTNESYAMLFRAGLMCIPVTYNEWNTKPDLITERFKRHLAIADLKKV